MCSFKDSGPGSDFVLEEILQIFIYLFIYLFIFTRMPPESTLIFCTTVYCVDSGQQF